MLEAEELDRLVLQVANREVLEAVLRVLLVEVLVVMVLQILEAAEAAEAVFREALVDLVDRVM